MGHKYLNKLGAVVGLSALMMHGGSVQAQQTAAKFTLLHGPYLQEVTTQVATIVYETSSKAFTWVEVKPHGSPESEARRCHASHDGLFEAYHTFGSVRIGALQPATRYDYRIVSKQMLDFQPYEVTFGDSIATGWHTFSTIDPQQKDHSIFITSDIHDEADKLENLLRLAIRTATTSTNLGQRAIASPCWSKDINRPPGWSCMRAVSG